MKKVGIRVDGGSTIGMGHIMRCMTIAEAFTQNGIEVIFISKVNEGINKLIDSGYKVVQLPKDQVYTDKKLFYGDINSLDKEIEEIKKIIENKKIDIMVIDSYNVTYEYLLKIKSYVKLVYIDDVNKFVYPVDVLVNGNIMAKNLNYEKYSEEEVLLLGIDYNLIRDEFLDIQTGSMNKDVKEIMVTTGGSDPYNLTPSIINTLLQDSFFKNIKFNIVVGTGFKNEDILTEISKHNKNIVLFKNPKKMSEIMVKSDLAISTGGSTLYELCACGIPTIAFIMAENQKEIVNMLSSKGYIESLGWYENLCSHDHILVSKVKDLCCDYGKREKLCKYAKSLIDCKGGERVVKEIKLLTEE